MHMTPCTPAQSKPSRARYALLCIGLAGELIMGGLMFGWNALSVMLKEEGVYAEGCDPDGDSCSHQDSKLNVVWTAGVFAVNFGLALAGVSVDYVGPKFTSSAGAALASAGLIALGFGVTVSSILPVGAFMVGLGGLSYHMSQFHTAQLFPQNKGFISSLYVGFFIASGVTFELLRAIYASMVPDEGPAHGTYRAILIAHALLCLPWTALMLWMNPRSALKVGQTYHFQPGRLRFVVAGREPRQQTPKVDGPDSSGSRSSVIKTAGYRAIEEQPKWRTAGVPASAADDPNATDASSATQIELSSEIQPDSKVTPEPETETAVYKAAVRISCKASSGCLHQSTRTGQGHDRLHNDNRPFPVPACSASQAKKHGYQLRQRWSMLASKPLLQQLKSPECICLGLIFIGNVYALQLYLGTARIQLEEMGDDDKIYLQMLSFIVPGVFVLAPCNGYFLDRLGFGVVLLVINALSLATAILQSISVLQLQVVNFLVWSVARYLMYSTFFTAVGTLFSYQSFGRITAVISLCQSLTGLTQLPLTDFAIESLDKDFTYIQIGQMVLVAVLFIPVILMYRWERIG